MQLVLIYGYIIYFFSFVQEVILIAVAGVIGVLKVIMNYWVDMRGDNNNEETLIQQKVEELVSNIGTLYNKLYVIVTGNQGNIYGQLESYHPFGVTYLSDCQQS